MFNFKIPSEQLAQRTDNYFIYIHPLSPLCVMSGLDIF